MEKTKTRHEDEGGEEEEEEVGEEVVADERRKIIHKLHVVDAFLCMPNWLIRHHVY